MEAFVQGSAINAYVYCPRRCYYEYVEQVFLDNFYTLHGRLLHEHVDHRGHETRGERELHRSLFLSSEKLGISIRCDLVEEENGEIYPVEYKRGRLADWENNHMQLCAQALVLEEQLGRPIPYGYLFFFGSFRRQKVFFDEELRTKTKEVIAKIRELYRQEFPPPGIDEPNRCKHCSLESYCLPQERNRLKGRVQWERFI